ncbi:MAG: NeuD/PglB/VioB family sugar acetyltransferase [Bacteroidales bacterium]|jgi:UDP-perosamine 4-acetyltransferase|nr:NeuD/PglB/VioB family sugar acetyltransferase [Bacteroidales bacterium]
MGIIEKKIVLIGSGGHANAILSALSTNQRKRVIGYVDLHENSVFSTQVKYLGTDTQLIKKFSPASIELILGVSYIGNKVDLRIRKRIINFFTENKYNFLIAVSPNSYISKEAKIDEGTFIAPGVKVISNAKISRFCSINTGAIIEHDVILLNNVQISPGVIVCGGVNIGENTFIGAGAIIRDGVSITSDTIIGMGCVVVKNINESGVYIGNPIKKIG